MPARMSTKMSTKDVFWSVLEIKKHLEANNSKCFYNWASGIWTHECRSQSPVPYRLAIAQYLVEKNPC